MKTRIRSDPNTHTTITETDTKDEDEHEREKKRERKREREGERKIPLLGLLGSLLFLDVGCLFRFGQARRGFFHMSQIMLASSHSHKNFRLSRG